jgi:hypothetical protein
MTKEELERQHPGLAAEFRAEGATAERARYDGHVQLGRQSGAITMALADYEAGKPLDGNVMAAHMDHAFRRRMTDDRLADDADAAAATDGAAGSREGSEASQRGQTALASAVERITRSGHEVAVMP